MAYATLEEQRNRLRTRLGFSAAGAAAGVQVPILNDFLRDAQVKLYWTHDWARLRRYETVVLGAAATRIDYPAAANPERISALSVYVGGAWSGAIKKGILPEFYTTQANPSYPKRWEPYEQIEFFPITDQAYNVRVFYVMALARFTQNADRSTIDDDLIFQLALGMGKSHYRHPDAQLYLTQGENLLSRLKAKSWGQDVFNPNDYAGENDGAPLAKPVVV